MKKIELREKECVRKLKNFAIDPKFKKKRDVFCREKKIQAETFKKIKTPIEKKNPEAEGEKLKNLMLEEKERTKFDENNNPYQEFYYDPMSYWAWDKVRHHKGMRIPSDKLPFFSYEQLMFVPTLSEISVSRLMRTIHPADLKPIISPSQKMKITIDSEKQIIKYLTAKDLVRVKDFLFEKYDILDDDHLNFRQEILHFPRVDVEPFLFPDEMRPEEFLLVWIRFMTEVLSSLTSAYIYVHETKKRYSHHLFYDFLHAYPKELPKGKCEFRFTSGLQSMSQKWLKVLISTGFDLDKTRPILKKKDENIDDNEGLDD